MPLLFWGWIPVNRRVWGRAGIHFVQTDRSVGYLEMLPVPRPSVKKEVGFPPRRPELRNISPKSSYPKVRGGTINHVLQLLRQDHR
jgi:hypothetical protein